MENEALNLNKRFFTFHNKKRPYIILKWVQTIDGFIDIIRNNSEIIKKPNWITNEYLRILVHKWRTEEQAIMVGTNTVINDNPQLNVRNFNGKNPLRISLDKDLKIPASYHLLDKFLPTIIYTSKYNKSYPNLEYKTIDFNSNAISQILQDLYERKIQSLLVEGGTKLIQSFYDLNIWDEARVFVGNKLFYSGIKAPNIKGTLNEEFNYYNDKLLIFENK
jgi:diaminohydroxyphosphoribosylaminopyrimidine deaminase/5-amino-6-(5-phosphoribosylamino)uracil reductase